MDGVLDVLAALLTRLFWAGADTGVVVADLSLSFSFRVATSARSSLTCRSNSSMWWTIASLDGRGELTSCPRLTDANIRLATAITAPARHRLLIFVSSFPPWYIQRMTVHIRCQHGELSEVWVFSPTHTFAAAHRKFAENKNL